MKEQTGSSDEYVEFMKAYNKAHECCPNCGTKPHSTTLAGYIVYLEDKDNYKDKNRCQCLKCGDVHIMHNRVPEDTLDTLPF